MSSTATRFLTQIRRNVESWRAGEMDFVTFSESQREAWSGVRAAGRHVEAEVLRALTGASRIADLLMLEDAQQRTVSLRVCPPAAHHPAKSYCGRVARTTAGSPVLRVLAADPRQAEPRRLAAMIYEIAADMERRSQQLEAHWMIAADPENGEVIIEITGDHEVGLADELIANVMTERDLI